MKILWTSDLNSPIYQDALDIRYKVFVDEQKVPKELEIDDLEDSSLHVVLYQSEQAIATARLYKLDDDSYKVQRVAVLRAFRKNGFGKRLMKEVEKKAKMMQAYRLILDSQNTAIPFYEKLGYKISSSEFMDAGIPHHRMIKKNK